jgi:hypothetical protein
VAPESELKEMLDVNTLNLGVARLADPIRREGAPVAAAFLAVGDAISSLRRTMWTGTHA